jgi:hypothetical protein
MTRRQRVSCAYAPCGALVVLTLAAIPSRTLVHKVLYLSLLDRRVSCLTPDNECKN